MCSSVILFRKENPWPIIIGSNRDELLSRKSNFPNKHWPKLYPHIIGGYDQEKKGTWIAVSKQGLVSFIHNRSLRFDNNLPKKSRGQIILDLLSFDLIEEAVEHLQNLNQKNFKGFNIIICNKLNCFWGKHTSIDKKIEVKEVPEGLSILTNKDLNDLSDKKTNYYLNKFSQTPIPDPNKDDWLSWELLLATESIENQSYPEEAFCFINKNYNYGTKSSSLIAISNSSPIKKFKNPFVVFNGIIFSMF